MWFFKNMVILSRTKNRETAYENTQNLASHPKRTWTRKDILSHTDCHKNLFTPSLWAIIADLFLALSLYLTDLQTSGNSWASRDTELHQKYLFVWVIFSLHSPSHPCSFLKRNWERKNFWTVAKNNGCS